MPEVIFLQTDGLERRLSAPSGMTILEVAKANDLPMVGTCGGSMVCATCHVIITPPEGADLPAPSESEEDALDLAFGVTPQSRLGCQVELTDDLNGIRIQLTSTLHS